MKTPKPHPKNVPGDFYVEDGCCTSCSLPQAEAPEHFEWDYEDNEYWPGEKAAHCYICKQPSNQKELEKMYKAMMVQEMDCIRYKGNNLNIIKAMKKDGNGDLIDAEI